MFTTTSSDLPPHKSAFQIKQDDKFFSRLLSKETSLANPSFRVYYGGVNVTVPFMWESQPGTPKYCFTESTLPPLTPPPSYYSHYEKKSIKKHYSRSNLLHFLFSRIDNNHKKSSACATSVVSTFHSSSSYSSASSPTPSSASSSWSSFNSSRFLPSTPRRNHERRRFSSRGSSFHSRAYDEEAVIAPTGSPASTLCFGVSNRGITGGFKGCYTWW